MSIHVNELLGMANEQLSHFPLPIWNKVYSLFCSHYIRSHTDLLGWIFSLIFCQITDLLTFTLKHLYVKDFSFTVLLKSKRGRDRAKTEMEKFLKKTLKKKINQCLSM